MKKKILFVLNSMELGGIAKSLSNLLFYMEKYKDDYDVDLLLFKQQGFYIKEIPKYVKLINEKKSMQIFGVSQKESTKYGKLFHLKRTMIACFSRFFTHKLPLKIAIKKSKLEEKYDLAIAFTHTQRPRGMSCGCPEYVLYGVNAKKKCMVVHGDAVSENLLSRENVNNYKKFDKVYSVSKSCSKQIINVCPQLANVSDYLYNIQLNDVIIKKSKEKEIEFDKSKLNIISVSRLSEEKAHIRSLKVMKRLKDEGFDFNWHILGDGTERENIEKCIKENNLEDCVKLYGNQSNPYPYIKSADLFYLGSYHEAAPMVYAESMTLGIPVLTTETCSAKELVDEKFGWICDNNEDGIYQGLKEILSNPKLVEEKRKNLKDFSYDNDAIIKKLISLID